MRETDDEEQLSFAVIEQRAIVTFNHKHFSVLHQRYLSEGKDHWGIIFSTEETLDVLRRRLLRLLNSNSEEDLKNKIYWLNEYK